MADNIYYDMGQIRYNSSLSYLTDLNFHSYPISTLDGQNKYRDILLIPDKPSGGNGDYFKFSNGTAYHLDLDIPTNLSYNMTFDIMLVNAEVRNDTKKVSIKDPTQYQEVRRIVVSKDKRNIKTYSDVILYPSPNVPKEGEDFAKSRPVACVVYDYGDEDLKIGEVYYDNRRDGTGQNVGEYKWNTTGNQDSDEVIKNYNIVSMAHTWLTETSTDYEHFDIVFSKKVSDVDFNAILLKMDREAVTNGITFESKDKEGNTLAEYNGLHVKTEFLENLNTYEGKEPKIEQHCNRITNLIEEINSNASSISGTNKEITKFNNIGVWSHPDSILAINGEEIRIGQSGYYELNDFDITNFGIVVKTPKDKFSVDYQYPISDMNDETEGGN